MGEIAEMMLEGTLCECCGAYIEGDAPGYPRYCSDQCADDRGAKPQPRKQSRGKSLPRFNRYSIPPREGTIQCKLCPAWVKPQGMNDHLHAKHPDHFKVKEPRS